MAEVPGSTPPSPSSGYAEHSSPEYLISEIGKQEQVWRARFEKDLLILRSSRSQDPWTFSPSDVWSGIAADVPTTGAARQLTVTRPYKKVFRAEPSFFERFDAWQGPPTEARLDKFLQHKRQPWLFAAAVMGLASLPFADGKLLFFPLLTSGMAFLIWLWGRVQTRPAVFIAEIVWDIVALAWGAYYVAIVPSSLFGCLMWTTVLTWDLVRALKWYRKFTH